MWCFGLVVVLIYWRGKHCRVIPQQCLMASGFGLYMKAVVVANHFNVRCIKNFSTRQLSM